MTEPKPPTKARGAGKTKAAAAKARSEPAPEAPPEAPVAPPEAPVAPPAAAAVQVAEPEGLFSLERCVEFVLRAIVQNQEALTIVRKDEEDKVRIAVSVAPEDLGKVIGKQGRTINALRTVVKTAAARTDTQVMVDLEGRAV